MICPTGLLVCSLHDNCTCQDSHHRIFNVPEFSLNRSSSRPLEDLEVQPPLPSEFAFITLQCCEAAIKCCEQVLSADSDIQSEVSLIQTTHGNLFLSHAQPKQSVVPITCPATWDGWQCFERSEPGIVIERCPNYIFGDRLRHDFDNEDTVNKECLSTGEWFKVDKEESPAEWTDYSQCLPSQAFALKLLAGIIAFSITVLAIVPAIFIISLQTSLRQQLVFIIHKHLLYSFLFSGICYLFNCFFFVIDGAPGDHLYFMNHFGCRLLFTAQLRYFRLSTFAWMLAEGLYLYRLLMCTFTSESESFKPYFALCWGIPLVITIIYSILRQNFDNEKCWVSPSKEFWIEWTIIGPCLLVLCVSYAFSIVKSILS
uniref:Uncharacterized protein n=1 Tax=Acrobeloides nanus TaxID=290746 RepID=A0A914EJI7_9BILA